ncbi:tryptophan halogenase family protein [Novosphingopyxis sp.]|uniref:tryptophan halogenase family protein n=1 Tax=Novosphingopyxis sp. TaxID=2709690 RepID=UPI003B5A01EE
MTHPVRQIVIVGGGTAGWLSACMIAARRPNDSTTVTLIEAPDIPAVGVGEGTWPTMRRTLATIGIAESDFLRECDASFKQGSRFDGWVTGETEDSYLHPFTAPPEGAPDDLLKAWQAQPGRSFAEAVSAQTRICKLDCAPRQRVMPDYAGALNYAYHLDATKLVQLLKRHACDRLGVRHIADHMTAARSAENGDIAAAVTRAHGEIAGDLFIDCTGHAARLIGEQMGVPWIDRGNMLFNDRALAVQLPVAPDSPIASQTIATAHEAGWIWDIGLPTRRGIGCVYAAAHMDQSRAREMLADYVRTAMPGVALDDHPVRLLAFASGHRERFWQDNCLAIGLSAGFLEPLEASAIVLIELSLQMLLDNFPADSGSLPIHAERFNRTFRYRWDRIVDFLKLHYVLSRRNEPYWRAHRDPASVPERVTDLLRLWRDQPPSVYDFPERDEVFPAASHQYVLYGMSGPSPPGNMDEDAGVKEMRQQMRQIDQRARALASALPTNRAYLDALAEPAPALAGETAR